MKQTNMDPKLIVGANLKRAIKASIFRTQEKFAEEFCTDVRNVSRWCNEGIDSIDTVWKIAAFLNISVSTLLPL